MSAFHDPASPPRGLRGTLGAECWYRYRPASSSELAPLTTMPTTGAPASAKRLRAFLNHDEFRMGRWILPAFATIMSSSEDDALMHEDRADRDFPDGGALRGLLECRAHEH